MVAFSLGSLLNAIRTERDNNIRLQSYKISKQYENLVNTDNVLNFYFDEIGKDAPETPSDPANRHPAEKCFVNIWFRPDNTVSCRIIVPDINL